MKHRNQVSTPPLLASVQNTKGNLVVFPVSTLPVIHLTQIKLAPSASLCLLVNVSGSCDAARWGFENLLSATERQQYAGIAQFEERRRRQTTRAVLRMVLGQLTGVSAAEVNIVLGPHGKPCLTGSRAVGFSVSHSGEFSLLAFAPGAEIGCDIEQKTPLEDIRALSEVALHPEEAEVIRGLDGRDAEDAFFCHWVRKEAALKAMGSGFRADPVRLKVGLADSEVRLRLVGEEGRAPTTFNLLSTRLATDYVAAVASPYPACQWGALGL